MRFHFGAIPGSPDFTPDALWKPLRQPSPWMALFVAFPIGIVAAGVVAVLWLAMTPLHIHDVTSTLSLRGFLVSFAGMVVVHELIHVAVHPMSGRSPHSIVGFGPSTGFYAHYDGEMTRNRFVAILLMPLVVISFVPLLVAEVVTSWRGWLEEEGARWVQIWARVRLAGETPVDVAANYGSGMAEGHGITSSIIN